MGIFKILHTIAKQAGADPKDLLQDMAVRKAKQHSSKYISPTTASILGGLALLFLRGKMPSTKGRKQASKSLFKKQSSFKGFGKGRSGGGGASSPW